MTPHEFLQTAIQRVLDAEGDGWHAKDWVVVVGLEKIDSDGRVDATAWMVAPPQQADYITDGLIATAEDMRANADIDDD